MKAININTIKHIALALVAGIALAGGAHAQAGKKEQEPIFDGSLDDFVALMSTNGGRKQFAQGRIGRPVVLGAYFYGATVKEPLFFDKSKKRTGTIMVHGKPDAGMPSPQYFECNTDDLPLIQRLSGRQMGQEIRIRANIAYDNNISRMFLDSCQVL